MKRTKFIGFSCMNGISWAVICKNAKAQMKRDQKLNNSERPLATLLDPERSLWLIYSPYLPEFGIVTEEQKKQMKLWRLDPFCRKNEALYID